jgi:hypothetical protein
MNNAKGGQKLTMARRLFFVLIALKKWPIPARVRRNNVTYKLYRKRRLRIHSVANPRTDLRGLRTGLPIMGPTASIPLTKDELLRGDLQFQVPMTRDFALPTDIFHDFNRVGGLRENIGVELRFLKLFLPPLPPNESGNSNMAGFVRVLSAALARLDKT